MRCTASIHFSSSPLGLPVHVPVPVLRRVQDFGTRTTMRTITAALILGALKHSVHWSAEEVRRPRPQAGAAGAFRGERRECLQTLHPKSRAERVASLWRTDTVRRAT